MVMQGAFMVTPAQLVQEDAKARKPEDDVPNK